MSPPKNILASETSTLSSPGQVLSLTDNNLVYSKTSPMRITKTIPVENVDSYTVQFKEKPKSSLRWGVVCLIIGFLTLSSDWSILFRIAAFASAVMGFLIWKYGGPVDLTIHSVSSKTEIAMTLSQKRHQDVLDFFQELEKTKSAKRRS